jgi:hypothetical protein
VDRVAASFVVLRLVARNVATPRMNEVASAAGNEVFPFTHSAANSENAATNSPPADAKPVLFRFDPIGGSYVVDQHFCVCPPAKMPPRLCAGNGRL